jgi:DNA invertase Pin-like site-specific DNA recombinase
VKTIGYLRVSTGKQENEKNKVDILKFANDHSMGNVEFVEETVSGTKEWRNRKIAEVLGKLELGDNLIVSELSRLGRSMLGILEVMKVSKTREINVYAIKGGWTLNDTIQSKMVAGIFAMLAEVERDLISDRTKEALAARRKANPNLKLSLPKGPGKRTGCRSSSSETSAPTTESPLFTKSAPEPYCDQAEV